jgi:citrate synthase
MKVGRQEHTHTAICGSNPDAIVVRGHDLCRDLIGQLGFTEYVWLLITGRRPQPGQRAALDATLLAIAEHGLVPSVQASRMTLAAAPEALQGAVAAGILGCGSVLLGSAEAAGRFLDEVVRRSRESAPETAAREVIARYRAERRAIPGYGHPLHKGGDPRTIRLLQVAEENGTTGEHIAAAGLVERLLPEITGRQLAMNVSAAIPAVLLDAGYPLPALKGVPILARTAGLIAHLVEEQQRPIGFVMSHAAASAISYDGPAPEGFVESDS